MIIWIVVIAACVALDQVTKTLIVNSYALGESHEIIGGIINFHYIRNSGAAWGMLSEHRWIFIVVSAVLIAVLPIFLYKYRKTHVLFGISMSLIIGGAIGNMIDRVFLGYVIDFIEFGFFQFPVFNVADSFVTVGAVMMFVYLLFIDKTIFKSDGKKSARENTQSADEVKNDADGESG